MALDEPDSPGNCEQFHVEEQPWDPWEPIGFLHGSLGSPWGLHSPGPGLQLAFGAKTALKL